MNIIDTCYFTGAVGAGVMPLLGATGGKGYKLHKEVGPLETHDVRGNKCKSIK